MIYEYKSFITPYILLFLERQKIVLSDFSYAHYCGILRHFDHYVAKQGYDSCNFAEGQILGWVATVEGRGSTVNFYVCAVREFFKSLNGHGFHPFMPPRPKVSDDYMAYEFSDDEIESIFAAADSCLAVPGPRRKYVHAQYEFPLLLRLLFGCGLRLGEASMLRLGDVDFNNNVLTIRKTKRKEYRLVPMHQSLADILSNYCISLGIGTDPKAFVFPGTDFDRPIPSYTFRQYFGKLLHDVGISFPSRKKHERGPCLHCLRHAFAHRSFKKGAVEGWAVNDQIPWLSVYLGHRSLQGTERYLKYNSNMFTKEIEPFESYSAGLYPEVSFDE